MKRKQTVWIIGLVLLCSQQLSMASYAIPTYLPDPHYHAVWSNDWTDCTFTVIEDFFLVTDDPTFDNETKTLTVGNLYSELNYKSFVLCMHFDTSVSGWADDLSVADATLTAPIGSTVTDIDYDLMLGQGWALWKWRIDPQPAEEYVTFSKLPGEYDGLTAIEFGTKCIPEPGSLVLMSMVGGVACFIRRFRIC